MELVMKRNRKDPSELAEIVLDLRNEGMGIAEIARNIRKGNAFVTKVLKANHAYGRPYYLTEEEKKRTRELRYENLSADAIAEEIGRSKYAVLEQLKKLKLNDRWTRPVVISGDTGLVHLTRGNVARIDASDVPKVEGRSWFTTGNNVSGHIYAATRIDGKINYLHRFLLDAPADRHVDHIDGDTLNNRLCNLRLATPRQNSLNHRREPGKSAYRGVTKNKNGTYYATILENIGTFGTAEEAALAYDKRAVELGGEFAMTNEKMGLLKKKKP